MGYKKTCFKCRKSFNRPIDFGSGREYPCPQCSKPMTLMTHRFRPPKKDDTKSWEVAEFLSEHGFIYQSIFETPSGGTHINYPTTKRAAKDFVIRYKEQSTNWPTSRTSICKTEKLQPQEIAKLLQSFEQILLDLSESGYEKKYFYKLVKELSNCLVQEVRPIQYISIERDVDSSEYNLYKEEMLQLIENYNNQRKTVFKTFLEYLELNQSSSFSEITKAMKTKGQYPKGKFDSWRFWQHGSDIEFRNSRTDEHINILMANKDSLNPDSLFTYIHSQSNLEGLTKVIAGKLKNLIRMLDLLVLDNRLIDIDNTLRMKIIQVNESLQITQDDQGMAPTSPLPIS